MVILPRRLLLSRRVVRHVGSLRVGLPILTQEASAKGTSGGVRRYFAVREPELATSVEADQSQVESGATRHLAAREADMSAVLAAVADNHVIAERAPTRLVKDGFPTDRVELTSRQELGQANVVPAAGILDKLALYFQPLFPGYTEQPAVQSLQRAVLEGQAGRYPSGRLLAS